MVELRMDRRVARRVDASDVVQEALAEAWRELSDYLKKQPLPFYPWLRQIAWERLMKAHRFHLEAQKRSLRREHFLPLSDRSSIELVERLLPERKTSSDKLVRSEERASLRNSLDSLPEQDREVLVLLYLEQLSNAEAASVLGTTPAAVKMRHLRALRKLRRLMGPGS
jgi:RNA polymerase sigma-70 factor (ECF subfamily)